MPSVTSLAEVRAVVGAAETLSDDDLQAIIDRQEAWLATQVGPLTGSRTERYWPTTVPLNTYRPLRLRRYATTVTVTDATVSVASDNVRLSPTGYALLRTDGPWIGPVDVTYTPDDEATVKEAVISLVGLVLGDQAYQSESMGDYSYSRPRRPVSFRAERRRIVADLTGRSAVPSSVRVRGANPIDAGNLGGWGALLGLANDQTNRGG